MSDGCSQSTDQRSPSQWSAWFRLLLIPFWISPTAQQLVEDVHDIPVRLLESSLDRMGLGICAADQMLPFQRSASFRDVAVVGLLVLPTAQHALFDMHETSASAPNRGTRTCPHLVPFQ